MNPIEASKAFVTALQEAEKKTGLLGVGALSKEGQDIYEDYYGKGGVGKYVDKYKAGDIGSLETSIGVLASGAGRPIEDAIAYTIANPVTEGAVKGMMSVAPELGISEAIGEFAKKADEQLGVSQFMEDNQRALDVMNNLSTLSGVGTAAKGLLKGAAGITDAAMEGFEEASGDIILPNFYGPRTDRFGDTTENLLQMVAPDKGWDPAKSLDENLATMATSPELQNELQNKLRKGLGAIQWGFNGAKRVVKNAFNPKAQALWQETGIGPIYKEVMGRVNQSADALRAVEARKPPAGSPEMKEWKADLTRAQNQFGKQLEIAHSQMQQLHHIRVQGGHQATKADMTYQFALASADPNSPYVYFRPEDVGDGSWYHVTGARGATRKNIDKTESDFVQNHVMSVWKDLDPSRARIIVKKPMSYVSGAHFLDLADKGGVAAGKFKDDLAKIFIEQAPEGGHTMESLKKALDKKAGGKNAEFSVIGNDETGYYLQVQRKGRKGGRGKVEGGINLMVKVDPQGNMTGYMSDLHDFLEKAPGIGPVLERTLPTQVLAVSPPMQTNIFSIVTEGRVDKTFGAGARKSRAVPRPSPEGGKTAEQLQAYERLKSIENTSPSTLGVVRRIPAVAGNVNLAGNIGASAIGGADVSVPKNQPSGMLDLPVSP